MLQFLLRLLEADRIAARYMPQRETHAGRELLVYGLVEASDLLSFSGLRRSNSIHRSGISKRRLPSASAC